jgi:Coenzyme PQQ synthesis protein D (PqqD)
MSSMPGAARTLRAAGQHPSCDLGGEAIVLDVARGTYFGLDAVGARVWSLLQQARTLPELRDAIVREFDVDPDRCEADLLTFVRQLRLHGLVEEGDAAAG